MMVYADKIPLTSLRIIRGRELYEWDNNYYSLYVAKNHKAESTTVGLMELQLVSLYGKYVRAKIITGINWTVSSVQISMIRPRAFICCTHFLLFYIHCCVFWLEILNGDVFMFNNNLLCLENHINWTDILGEGAKITFHPSSTDYRRTCKYIQRY